MLTTFLATLTPMLSLFFCIAVGFAAKKCKLLPDNAGKTMAKLETWVFCPALSFTTMARYCTVETVGTHAQNLVLAACGVFVAIGIAIPLSRLFAKPGTGAHGVYLYALTFANSGYMGDPVVQGLFGDEILSYYKLFCLPISVAIYTWGISRMIPGDKGGALRKLVNPPMVGMFLGIFFGLTGLTSYLPAFVVGSLDALCACMGPVAMLLAGFTIASYPLKEMLTDRKVYVATALRLTLLPSVIVAVVFGLKTAAGALFGLSIGNEVLYYTFIATGAALGLNTVIFPEAYGGNPKTGAGMTLISHTLAVITIPLALSLLTLLFGNPFAA
ncbi:MAG: AEC family transporter [Clostridia bacterium]|nr:AEC family transporter [Clostridia bacterium]